MGFLFNRSKKSSNNSSEKGQIVDPFQRQLEVFQAPPQKRLSPIQETSVRQIEDEVDDELTFFQSYISEIKETSLKLDELTKMLRTGEISENVYGIIIDELGSQLSRSVEEIFRLREMLELARAKAKLEWAKVKIGLREFEKPEYESRLRHDVYLRRELYSPLYRWEEITSKIDSALSSLTMEEEASIIERYLSLIKGGLSIEAGSDGMVRSKQVCQRRLNSISEKWGSIRRGKIEQVMNRELKASQIKEEIKEAEVRFAIGELDQREYEYRVSALQGSLKNIQKEISQIRSHIDEMDMRIFRCTELLGEES